MLSSCHVFQTPGEDVVVVGAVVGQFSGLSDILRAVIEVIWLGRVGAEHGSDQRAEVQLAFGSPVEGGHEEVG